MSRTPAREALRRLRADGLLVVRGAGRRTELAVALVEAAAGNRLRELLAVVAPQADRYEWMYAPMVGPDHSATFAEHGAIVAAVRAGAADELEAAVRANWLNSSTRLLAALDRWGSRGEWVLPPDRE
ncbi:MAG TPA: FCD domain-containing protein [Longimicrobium sp.]|nr:FCD domain-containing protein [Longimicrobium sp.]